MSKKSTSDSRSKKPQKITIEGSLELESRSTLPADISLSAFAVDEQGEVLASSEVKPDGKYKLEADASAETVFDLVVTQTESEADPRENALFTQHISTKDLASSTRLRRNIFIALDIWRPWWPKQICISGHVRKVPNCPIPFVKVEIFDVDRGPCLWPWYNQFKALVRRQRVVRIEDIQAQIPELDRRLLDEAFVDTSGAAEAIDVDNDTVNSTFLNALPELETKSLQSSQTAALSSELLAKPVTLTSQLAPWILYPHCFYKRQLLCTTTTNQYGYFKCCFKWYPLQYRNGQFKYDYRPDIILRVTQTINGVSKVIYMDAYANTRWNSSGAHIDLFLDDPEIECGTNNPQPRPSGSVAFFTRIGNDDVYRINQTNGTFDEITATSNMAYGHALRIFAQFGDTLSRAENIAGAVKPYFYKVSVNDQPINTALKDTRVHKGTFDSESHVLGPVTRGAETTLYEIRDFKNYYWYNPDWISNWITATTSGVEITKLISDGLKTVKLEVFDNNGNLLTNTKVNYLDGTHAPTVPVTPLPAIYPCTMEVRIDNNAPQVNMQVTPAPSGCGVIPFANVPPLTVTVDVNQANNRINNWHLRYIKGTMPGSTTLASLSSGSGAASVTTHVVDADAPPTSMLTGLTGTCAFALTLYAEAHVRNGYAQIYDRSVTQAIAIEKCPECPPD